ncbi:Ig-like domain repeat protein [Rhizobacter sp. AJA081-3]|uniref:RHS repeat domain-containing protein n=1 Tax=Rhizobacter sp. AJA081-3 TaxID=2753607 RepID=UPI001AE01AB5|nr:Ig-like domain repeat protein [Rhizobacter sp. AJA081-3]QTN25659.1 Ig-like domain repeat protein [Rhizobacter sp. AJA081-3]
MQLPAPFAAYTYQYITFTASVSGTVGTPTGTVTFMGGNGGGAIVSAPLVNGVATTSGYIQYAGSYDIYANYSGDSNYGSATSIGSPGGVRNVSITAQTQTTTTLGLSASTVAAGQNVTLTAHVEPSANPGNGSTTFVTFYDGSVALGVAAIGDYVSRNASLTTSLPTVGTRAFTAVYGGAIPLTASTSSVANLVVTQAATTTTVSASPSTAYQNQNVTLTASVTGANPTGSVTFTDGAATLGTAALTGGQATLVTSFAAAGSHSVAATFSGDTNNLPGSSAPVTQTVQATAVTSTALSASPASITVGQQVMLTATVAGGASATGTVTFRDGSVVLGTVPLTAGTASLPTTVSAAGSHPLIASYSGDVANGASTSATNNFNVAKMATSTTLNVSPDPLFQGQLATLRANVAGFGPSGTVTFFDGATTLGTASIANGLAAITTTFNQISHSLSASYTGDANNLASASAVTASQTYAAPALSAAPVVNYEYDATGNPTKTIQAPGVAGFNFATTNTFDSLSRLKDSTDAKTGKTQFGYNGREDLTQVTDPRNLVTQYPRNGLGDATSLVSPDTGTANHTYDAAGNLKTRTDSRGVLATYTYDALNRLTKIVYSQTGQTSLTYTWTYDQTGTGYANGVGRLTSTNTPTSSSQYTYDAQGRLLTDIQRIKAATGANSAQIAKTVTYTYDTAGNVTSILYPSGRKLTVGYTAGQPTSLALAKNTSTAAVNLITQIQWEPFGGPRSWLWQMASGTKLHAWLYDTSGRLVRQNLGNNLRDLSYDAADRITGYAHYDATSGAAQTSLNQTFSYDELGRITGVVTPTASWTIGYDANGNRTSVTLNGTASTYTTATTSNRLNSITNPARSLGYDAAGNTTSDSYTATYNLAGRMATLTKAAVTTTYAVDGMGKRVRKFDGSGAASTVLFVYDQQGQLLGEYNSAGTASREYVWLGNTPVAVFTPDPANSANPPLVYYIHTDHLGTPRIVVDKSGNQRWNWLAEPFGTTAPNNNPSALGAFTFNLRFPGQYADQESGLFYNYFRDYDASAGRYVQSDPIGLAGGINTYSYALNQPTLHTDPDGRQVVVVTTTQSGPRYDPRSDTLVPPTAPTPSFTPAPASPSAMCQAFPLMCAATIATQICRESNETDRCRQRLSECRQVCQGKWERGDPPFSGSDTAGRMRRCIRDCMEAGGCFNY